MRWLKRIAAVVLFATLVGVMVNIITDRCSRNEARWQSRYSISFTQKGGEPCRSK